MMDGDAYFDSGGWVDRKNVRHEIMRARNTRIAETRDSRWPALLRMHSETLRNLLLDSDPDEHATLDFEGLEFMRIPIETDDQLDPGRFELSWPELGGPE